MLKKIKTTKEMNVHELIKHVWDNGITDRTYRTHDNGAQITFDYNGDIETEFCIEKRNIFRVEIEEPITEYTEFDCILEIRKGRLTHIRRRKTIKENLTEETERFYALIDGKLQLVWEADGDE